MKKRSSRKGVSAQNVSRKGAGRRLGKGKADLGCDAGARRSEGESSRQAVAIVGIGASAGGFEAVSELLQHLGTKTGMAYVFVQHLDPSRKSQLAELLARVTEMPVSEVKNNTRVRPDQLYVAPPNHNVALLHGVLSLMP